MLFLISFCLIYNLKYPSFFKNIDFFRVIEPNGYWKIGNQVNVVVGKSLITDDEKFHVEYFFIWLNCPLLTRYFRVFISWISFCEYKFVHYRYGYKHVGLELPCEYGKMHIDDFSVNLALNYGEFGYQSLNQVNKQWQWLKC